jgi:hypothetical protein
MEDFPFDTDGSEDLLFFGRIHPGKGMAEAIAAAHRSGRNHGRHRQDQNLTMRRSRPPSTIDLWSTWAPAGGAARTKTLGAAHALLHLIHFDAPFGLSARASA